MIDFTGKAVIVTGAAAGIGKACARAFAKAGASVLLADINAAANKQAAADIARETGAQTVAVAADVSDDKACAEIVAEAIRRFGRVDVLVNNAAILSPGGVVDLDPSDFDRVMRINLRSYFVLTQLVARHMIEMKIEGSIINMSSVNSVVAIANQLAYVTAKGGVQQLTTAAALELAAHGIRVNAVGPGSIMTDLLKKVVADAAARRAILARTPLGRIGEPEEIASVALFLASEMASYVTGQTIFADGGRSTLNYTVPVRDD